MREILFRGERIDNGKWVYGYYCHCVPALNSGKTYPAIQQTDDGSLYFREIIPETVGQYTGLTDKNGKKIFEGDLLLNGCDTYLVRWECGNLEYVLEDSTVSFSMACVAPGEIEVIGNIYDNPELLGGAGDGNC